MSGGVDSSVSAALLKNAAKPDEFKKLTGRPAPKGFSGFDVSGVHIKMWSDPEIPCVAKEDRYDAMRAAAALDIPFQTWDFTEEYRREVVEYMIREYAAGRTPNPDVMCNRHIKFGAFLRRALAEGADYVATGHYVRLRRTDEVAGIDEINEMNGGVQLHQVPLKAGQFTKRSDSSISSHQLLTAVDASKDQSYFLWTLTQEQLRHCLFPIGEYKKPEVRTLARKFGLPTAEKPDSQGICFIGEIDVRDFLKRRIPERRGRIFTTGGKAVGEHAGIEFFTIGQREGLGIGGGIPYYVAEKDPVTNTLTVAEGPYDEKLFQRKVMARDLNWISGRTPKLPLRCEARIRYRQPLQRCTVGIAGNDEIDEVDLSYKRSDPTSEAIHQAKRSNDFIVTFDDPQRAVTPGQSIVFYNKRNKPFDSARGKIMLGGGIIC